MAVTLYSCFSVRVCRHSRLSCIVLYYTSLSSSAVMYVLLCWTSVCLFACTWEGRGWGIKGAVRILSSHYRSCCLFAECYKTSEFEMQQARLLEEREGGLATKKGRKDGQRWVAKQSVITAGSKKETGLCCFPAARLQLDVLSNNTGHNNFSRSVIT